MYDVNEHISYVICIAQIHKDAKRLEESLNDFITNFGDDGKLSEEMSMLRRLRQEFYNDVLNQTSIAVHNIEIEYREENATEITVLRLSENV